MSEVHGKCTTALILAGGLGTRLRSRMDDRPKVLAQVSGRPFLSYLLDQLHAAGVTRVILSTGYKGDMVKKHFGATFNRLRLEYSQETTLLGTGGALRLALPLYKEERALMVLNGDSFCRADLVGFYRRFEAAGMAIGMALVKKANTERYGRVEHDGRRVTAFTEKGDAVGPGWINAGIYLLRPEIVQTVPPDEPISLERDLLPPWLEKGIFPFPAEGGFIDIGTPRSYDRAEEFFALVG